MIGMSTILTQLLPNGHRGRFIGGYEKHLQGNQYSHTRMRQQIDLMNDVTKFLAYGIPPLGATFSKSANDCENNPPQTNSNPIPPSEFLGEYRHSLTADANTTSECEVCIDRNSSAKVSIFLDRHTAQMDLLDPQGNPIIPSIPQITEFGGGKIIEFVLTNPDVGTYHFQLRSVDNTSNAIINLQYDNEGSYLKHPIVPSFFPIQENFAKRKLFW
jgi:hypothetical protein